MQWDPSDTSYSVTTDGYHQPYLGSDGTTPTLVLDANNPNYEKSVTFSSSSYSSSSPSQKDSKNPYRIQKCQTNCTTGTFDGGSLVVSTQLWLCKKTRRLPATSRRPSIATQVGTTNSITYIVPTNACEDDDATCAYPTVYGSSNSNPYAHEPMGWTNFSDMNQNADSGGWLFHSASAPLPSVMVARGYSPFTPGPNIALPTGTNNVQQSYTQTSTPCILRAMRPASAVLDNTVNYQGSVANAEHDYFPIFDASTDVGCATGNCTNYCDKLVDGLVQTDSYRINSSFAPTESKTAEIIPSITPAYAVGSGLPLYKMLSDAGTYFNGASSCSTSNTHTVDGFCAGKRWDDPSTCRTNAIILILDSLSNSNPQFNFPPSGGSDPLIPLTNMKIPVYVVGFSYPSAPTNGKCTLPDGSSGNLGQCIAYYTNAQQYDSKGVLSQQGYFEATDSDGLQADLKSILGQLNTATRDFATATIPSVSASSEGIAYLSVFNPHDNHSLWSGHLRAYFLDPTTGKIQLDSNGFPLQTTWTYATGTSPASGSLIWDAGNKPSDFSGSFGILGVSSLTDPTQVLSAGTAWSDSVHDQATGQVGRSIFFSLKPGDANCPSTNHVECIIQLPTGSGGNATTEPYTPPSPPSTLPSWWSFVQSSSSYLAVGATTGAPLSGESSLDQATQNDFSFFRGNRDPVVEALKLIGFSATNTTCASLASTKDSSGNTIVNTATPCYGTDVMGDIFHSNPAVASYPNDPDYLFTLDANASTPGLYSNYGHSYADFKAAHRYRRKVLFAGANDGTFHAFDIGVYNGDTSTFTSGGSQTLAFPNENDLGSGREIFAYVPRAALRKFDVLTHTTTQDYTLDGSSEVDDVYINLANVGGTPTGVVPPTSVSTDATHNWRTVVVGVEREGGITVSTGNSGNGGTIFALDVTDPDKANHESSTATSGFVGAPECLVNAPGSGTLGAAPSGCTYSYPMVLWEIGDQNQPSSLTATQVPTETAASTEANTQDMGMTWSRPIIGRVKTCTSNCNTSTAVFRDFFVAIVGGGYQNAGTGIANTNNGGQTGNFLYMIDVETGKVIYKRNLGNWSTGTSSASSAGNLPAAVPSEPAVVDYNLDGYVDRIYIGDTQGRLWKVALETPAQFDTVNARISDSDTSWNPALFFDQYSSSTSALLTTQFPGLVRQPIFQAPAVYIIGATSTGVPKLAIAFGTGDRDNMPILTDTRANSYVVLVDPPVKSTLPLFENVYGGTGDLDLTSPTNTTSCSSANTCLQKNGFYFQLPVGTAGAQIVNTTSVYNNNTLFFNTFLHLPDVAGACQLKGSAFAWILNSSTGVSDVVNSSNNPVLPSAYGNNTELLSDPVVYYYTAAGTHFPFQRSDGTTLSAGQGVSGMRAISIGDTVNFDTLQSINATPVKIKSWKEQ